ncbi:unnamed protein product [Bursaphelenchus xylophilus]|uniref:(pine wood nematode) hypothetical protein n=1 Tax=Bursaphelenchus xylophilus TaxID=6326 RepID=A0A1I7S7H7_BURXY|nr:unnamed protein product [Bursaphelenchus xylophilus]CAG9085105.1 unnamed protein product [Bursaphelenchus xylophilus]
MLDRPIHKRKMSLTTEEHRKRKANRRARRSAKLHVPSNVPGSDWREMCDIAYSNASKRTVSVSQGSVQNNRTVSKISLDSKSRTSSMRSLHVSFENTVTSKFKRRECTLIVPSGRNPGKCMCGLNIIDHESGSEILHQVPVNGKRLWSITENCKLFPTNAFGTIEFEGGPHPLKAQYLRCSFDSNPADIINYIQKVWKVEAPRLVVTVYGGMTNFPLQPKLARVFRKGLMKAAGISGTWIFTSGIDSCAVNHVTEALYGQSYNLRAKPITIGIAPWGLMKQRGNLIGMDKVVSYYRAVRRNDDGLVELNRKHLFFLLVDNGTTGRYGADIFLRRRLESYITEKQTLDIGSRRVPVVCLVLEGGRSTVRCVLDYVTSVPKIPVVVCDGSGRASDLISFAHKRLKVDGEIREVIREQLTSLIKDVFGYDAKRAKALISELIRIVRQKELVTVFRLGETPKQDLDNAILTALLKGQNLTPIEQLTLALAWDRADVARSDIFVMGQEIPKKALYAAMMDALIHNRVDFVRLLLENGVSMKEFLTIARLENLYNSSQGPKNTLPYIVDDVVKTHFDRYELIHIGLVVEKLMGNGFRSSYTNNSFRQKYEEYRQNVLLNPKNIRQEENVLSTVSTSQGPLTQDLGIVPPISGNRALSNHIVWRSVNRNGFLNRPDLPTLPDSVVIDIDEDVESSKNGTPDFEYPFSDLVVWAVLTRRHKMALCMWEHGEEALAKSLVACRLYKSLAKEASEDFLDLDIVEELRSNAEEFRELSVSLLDHCYKNDEMRTLELLTYEMSNWGRETSLTLAVMVNNKQFIAHPCCQALLADLWHGGMRIRSSTNLKVIMGLLFPPLLVFIDFKSAEELRRQPQTAAEHADDSSSESDSRSVGSGSRSSSSSSSSSSTSSSDDDVSVEEHGPQFGSMLFRSKRKKPKQQLSITSNIQSERDEYVLSPPKCSRTQSKLKSTENLGGTSDTASFNGRGSFRPLKKGKSIFSGKWKIKDDKIRFQRRIYEFFVAPITTFWSWTLSFAVFLSLYTYILLVKTPIKPSILEWIVFSYVVGFGMEIVRKLCMSDPKSIREKFEYFFLNYWNALTTVAIGTYLVGFGLRCNPSTRSAGRVVLATNSMLWSIKLLDFLSVHPRFGPYVTMAGKMIMNMSSIVVMLAISLLAFGLARQSITYPNEEWSWLLLRNVFYKPYFMLYGEVYADEIDTCGDEAWDEHMEKRIPVDALTNTSMSCVPGHWVPPLLMTVFLLIANILLISMLIAIFNNIFDAANKISHQIWLFQRYRQVMEYQNTSILPPPLTPLYHLHLVYKYLRFRYEIRRERLVQNEINSGDDPKKIQTAEKKRKQKVRLLREQLFDATLKLFFNREQIEKMHDFEEECMESLAREKEFLSSRTNEERLRRTVERTDNILQRVNDLSQKESYFSDSINHFENRLEHIENAQVETLKYLKHLSEALPRLYDALLCGEDDENMELNLEKKSSKQTSGMSEAKPDMAEGSNEMRNRSRTTTIGGEAFQKLGNKSSTSFGNLLSTEAIPIKTSGVSVNAFRSSVRRPQRNEYTSITDTIEIDRAEARAPFTPKFERGYIESTVEDYITDEEEGEAHDDSNPHEVRSTSQGLAYYDDPQYQSQREDNDDDYPNENRDTPNTTLRRAKSSFIRTHNQRMREYEEEIAGDSDLPGPSKLTNGSDAEKEAGSPRSTERSANSSSEFLQFIGTSNDPEKKHSRESI